MNNTPNAVYNSPIKYNPYFNAGRTGNGFPTTNQSQNLDKPTSIPEYEIRQKKLTSNKNIESTSYGSFGFNELQNRNQQDINHYNYNEDLISNQKNQNSQNPQNLNSKYSFLNQRENNRVKDERMPYYYQDLDRGNRGDDKGNRLQTQNYSNNKNDQPFENITDDKKGDTFQRNLCKILLFYINLIDINKQEKLQTEVFEYNNDKIRSNPYFTKNSNFNNKGKDNI